MLVQAAYLLKHPTLVAEIKKEFSSLSRVMSDMSFEDQSREETDSLSTKREYFLPSTVRRFVTSSAFPLDQIAGTILKWLLLGNPKRCGSCDDRRCAVLTRVVMRIISKAGGGSLSLRFQHHVVWDSSQARARLPPRV